TVTRKQAVNVVSTFTSRRLWSRLSLLSWVNDCLHSKIRSIDDLGTGAAYCCIMDLLFPNSIPMRRVFFGIETQDEYAKNFELLQHAFNRHGVNKIIPVDLLVKRRFQDNYDFAIWLRLFYEANRHFSADDYDVRAKRMYQLIGKAMSKTRRLRRRRRT
ncbi:hypothetical protein KR222_004216, partial [Zaprionus bogoriensis]